MISVLILTKDEEQDLPGCLASVAWCDDIQAMHLGAYSWICARATVNPGVNVGPGAILALGSVAIRDLSPSASTPASLPARSRSASAPPSP